MKVTATHKTQVQVELKSENGHAILVDLPEEKMGNNRGPTSLELTFMSLSGCIVQIFAMFAQIHELHYSDLQCELETEQQSGKLPLAPIKGTLTVTTSEPEEAKRIFKMTLRSCPVGKIFKNAGISYEISLKIQEPIAVPQTVVLASRR